MAAMALGFEGSEESLIARMDDAKERWIFHIKREVAYGVRGPAYEPVTNLTGRQYLQNFGNHARAVFGDTFWIDQVLPAPHYSFDSLDRETWLNPRENERNLKQRYPNVDVLCITDLRYENEAERIKLLGGVIWEVQRPGLTSDGHITEQPLPRELVDAEIINDSTLDVLEARVAQSIFETLR
jgi:hypothetical protein